MLSNTEKTRFPEKYNDYLLEVKSSFLLAKQLKASIIYLLITPTAIIALSSALFILFFLSTLMSNDLATAHYYKNEVTTSYHDLIAELTSTDTTTEPPSTLSAFKEFIVASTELATPLLITVIIPLTIINFANGRYDSSILNLLTVISILGMGPIIKSTFDIESENRNLSKSSAHSVIIANAIVNKDFETVHTILSSNEPNKTSFELKVFGYVAALKLLIDGETAQHETTKTYSANLNEYISNVKKALPYYLAFCFFSYLLCLNSLTKNREILEAHLSKHEIDMFLKN